MRTAGSSQANPFACIASGIAALWGPAHGGANEAVLKMLAVRGPAVVLVEGFVDGVCGQLCVCLRVCIHPSMRAVGMLMSHACILQTRGLTPRDPSHSGGMHQPAHPHTRANPRTHPPGSQEIGTKDRIPLYIARAKDKADPFRLMGFGHRVYKTHDPRRRGGGLGARRGGRDARPRGKGPQVQFQGPVGAGSLCERACCWCRRWSSWRVGDVRPRPDAPMAALDTPRPNP